MQLFICGYGLVEGVFIETPCFAQQAGNTVPVHRFAEFLLRYRKARPYWRLFGPALCHRINKPYR